MDAIYNYENTYDSLSLFSEKSPKEVKWYLGESYIKAFRNEIKQDMEQDKWKPNTFIKLKAFAEKNIVLLKPEESNLAHSRVKIQWEGCVTKVLEKSFKATLYNDEGEEFSAEFAKDDASEGDQQLIQENNVFYWSIGYRTSVSNQRTNEEKLIFRRLPGWKNFNLEKPSKRAKEFGDFFNQSEVQNAAQG